MRWITTETGVRVAGIACFLLAAYSIWLGRMTVADLPGGYSNPVLALELVKSAEHIDLIKSAEGGKAIPFLTTQVYKDFGYIVVYVIVFSWLGFLFSTAQSPSRPWLGWLLTLCMIVAGVLDVFENLGMLTALKNAGAATNSMASNIRYTSLGKWALLFAFSSVIGFLLLRHHGILRLTALLFLLAALCGVAGVVLNLISPRSYVVFPVAITCLALGVLSLAILLTFFPNKVLTA